MYLEFKKLDNSQKLVESLITFLKEHKLNINETKTKTNISTLPYSQINSSDCYLGLPFSQTKNEYIEECVKMFQNKYYQIEVEDIIDILENNEHKKIKKEIIGFFNYKLHGLKIFGVDEINVLQILKDY